MDELNIKCKNATKDYIKKYDKLISMVNGYENIGEKDEYGELKDLTGKIKSVINKSLISEDDFQKLKQEQNDIMNEYEDLEDIKDGDPFSKKAIKFTQNKKTNIYDIIKNKYEINLKNLLPKAPVTKAPIPKTHNITINTDKPVKKKFTLDNDKVMCNGGLTQYYKMPNISININTQSKKTKKKPKSKPKHKPKVKPKPKVKSKKCINNKLNNHTIF